MSYTKDLCVLRVFAVDYGLLLKSSPNFRWQRDRAIRLEVM